MSSTASAIKRKSANSRCCVILIPRYIDVIEKVCFNIQHTLKVRAPPHGFQSNEPPPPRGQSSRTCRNCSRRRHARVGGRARGDRQPHRRAARRQGFPEAAEAAPRRGRRGTEAASRV